MIYNVNKFINTFCSPQQKSCLASIRSMYGNVGMIQACQPPIPPPPHIPNLYDHIDELGFETYYYTEKYNFQLSDTSNYGQLFRGIAVPKGRCAKLVAYLSDMHTTNNIHKTNFWCMFTKTILESNMILLTPNTYTAGSAYPLQYAYMGPFLNPDPLYMFPKYPVTESDEAYFVQSNLMWSPASIQITNGGQVYSIEDNRGEPPFYNFSRFTDTYGEELENSYFRQRYMYVVNYDSHIYIFDDNATLLRLDWDSTLYTSYMYVGQTGSYFNEAVTPSTKFWCKEFNWTNEDKELLKRIPLATE